MPLKYSTDKEKVIPEIETNELSPITSFYCLWECFHDTALQSRAQAENESLLELRNNWERYRGINIQIVLRRLTDVPLKHSTDYWSVFKETP